MPSQPVDRVIWVHIGTHKTGTTSIQNALAANRERLRSHGLYVPTAGTTHAHSGHHNLAWQLRDDPRFQPGRGTLDDLLAELSTVTEPGAVISSEDFEYCVEYPQRLAGFERALRAAGWEPRYLVLFRRQSGYAGSLYAELLRHGLTASFPRFVAEILGRARFELHGDWCFHFDYMAFTARWARAASGTLHVRAFTRQQPGSCLIEQFLGAIGAPAEAVPSIAADARMLNVGTIEPTTPSRRLAGLLIDARFALTNARLRRRFGVDLRCG